MVKFTSAGGVARWDFGDGATSDERNPTHIFQKPGLYSVTLAVRDAVGGSSRAFQQIAVDRNVSEPIVRAGFPSGDSPALKIHGTARRGDGGSLHLPDGAPWGWVQADEGTLEDVRGLRSFTITGWLKPESLQVGSGGNRILFCLNRDHSGIDLVCHADGRLRLAVNQWPDAIKNDSSPDKLRVGKWTFFAVSYDATQSRENVNWYFSEALAAPGKPALALDRQTSYHAGAVGADPGPLAIGNFNQTMHSYGLDRQFRGEMRSLQLFGSRVDGRGAFTRQLILKHAP
jgi:PKD repeat protein